MLEVRCKRDKDVEYEEAVVVKRAGNPHKLHRISLEQDAQAVDSMMESAFENEEAS